MSCYITRHLLNFSFSKRHRYITQNSIFRGFKTLVRAMLTLDFDSSLPRLDDCTISVTVVSSVPSQSDSTTNLVKWITHEEVKALNLINVVVKHLVNQIVSLCIHDLMDAIPFLNLPRDHFESKLGIISGVGSFQGLYSPSCSWWGHVLVLSQVCLFVCTIFIFHKQQTRFTVIFN